MLNNAGFDLWADGYDKSVSLSDESGTYPVYSGGILIFSLRLFPRLKSRLKATKESWYFRRKQLMSSAKRIMSALCCQNAVILQEFLRIKR